jgi:MFS family permease
MGLMLLTMQALLGLVAVAFSLSKVIWLSQLLLFAGGALLVTCFSMTTSLVQLLAPHELRGRVVSIYMVAFRGGSPLGGLVSGWLVTLIGSAPYVLALNGGLLTVVALIAMTRDHGLREI